MALRPRAASARRQAWCSAALCLGIAAAGYLLARRLPWRADLTAERQYTLAAPTRALLGRLEDRLQVKLYFNRDILGAEALLPARLLIEDLLAEMRQASGGRLVVETVDPTGDQLAAAHAKEVGIVPVSLSTGDVGSLSYAALYQGVELRYQDRSEVIPFALPNGFEYAFAARLSALLAERRPSIGFFSREPEAPPEFPGLPEPPPPPERVYAHLRRLLRQRYAVEDVALDRDLPLAQRLTALVVAAPDEMNAREVYELDRYLAAGGHVLVLYDAERYFGSGAGTFERQPVTTGLDAWLAGHGVHVSERLVWDRRAYAVPVAEERITLPSGQQTSQSIRMNYGLWPLLQGDSFAAGHVVTAAQNELYLLWAHPVAVDAPPDGVTGEVLLRGSPQAWLLPADADTDWTPENLDQLNRTAAASGPAQAWPLAVALRGAFRAQVAAADAPPPRAEDGAGAAAAPPLAPAPGLLVVLGDSDLFKNEILERGPANAQFAENLLDWLAQAEQLIGLRSRGQSARPLRDFYREAVEAAGELPPGEAERQALDRAARAHERGRRRFLAWGNVLAPALLVTLLGLAHWQYWKRRAATPGSGA